MRLIGAISVDRCTISVDRCAISVDRCAISADRCREIRSVPLVPKTARRDFGGWMPETRGFERALASDIAWPVPVALSELWPATDIAWPFPVALSELWPLTLLGPFLSF